MGGEGGKKGDLVGNRTLPAAPVLRVPSQESGTVIRTSHLPKDLWIEGETGRESQDLSSRQ